MRHLQTYELTTEEHRSMKTAPFLLVLPASPHPQEITLSVASRRNGVRAALAPSGLKCGECGAIETKKGAPFTLQTLNAHLFRAHGKRTNGKRKVKK